MQELLTEASSESDSASPEDPSSRKKRTPFAQLDGQSAPKAGAATKAPPCNPAPAKPPAADQTLGNRRGGAKAAGKENSDGKG